MENQQQQEKEIQIKAWDCAARRLGFGVSHKNFGQFFMYRDICERQIREEKIATTTNYKPAKNRQ